MLNYCEFFKLEYLLRTLNYMIDKLKLASVRDFVWEYKYNFLQVILTGFFISAAIFFFKHEGDELVQIKSLLKNVDGVWLLAGIAISGLYISLQSLMYVFSFKSVEASVSFLSALNLFLKRNFVSVFLPAGGIASLLFFTKNLENQRIDKAKIHFASAIYAFVGLLSVLLVGVPVLGYVFVAQGLSNNDVLSLAGLLLLVGLLFWVYISLKNRGIVYGLARRFYPDFDLISMGYREQRISQRQFLYVVLCSVLIEFLGILHLIVAMKAFHLELSLTGASVAYIISVIFLIISPLLRGLGAIEVSMTLVLGRYGFSVLQAVAITLLYRLFEFWLPLVAGIFSFLFVRNNVILRLIPPFLIVLLGLINILSVLTPAIQLRLDLLLDYLPVEAINTANYLVFVAGVFLIIIGIFLAKGLKAAWYVALILSVISLVGHLTKAIDYEEAILAFFVILSLIYTRRLYYIKSQWKYIRIGIMTAVFAMATVMIFGIGAFYYLDTIHFSQDFSLTESVKYTLLYFFQIGSNEINPETLFARNFIFVVRALGLTSMAFLLYTLVRPYIFKSQTGQEDFEKAVSLRNEYGSGPLDYFKTYFDKLFFFPADIQGFISYRISGNRAVVLEDPVCKDPAEMKKMILQFDQFCQLNGMKSFYYRVGESSKSVYEELGKNSLLLGQEAVLDITDFSVATSKKNIRNAYNKVNQAGFVTRIYEAPVKDGLLQKLKAVSDEWLEDTEYDEIVFSQGLFDKNELKNQTILTVESPDEKVVAFINVIPDFVPGEATYDLIRKTKDAPNGIMDYLMISLFEYFKSKNYKAVNLGFAPMTGIENPQNLPERTIKFAAENLKQFARYKGLHDYKDKFAPLWVNKYLIYDDYFDLVEAPQALSKVIKP